MSSWLRWLQHCALLLYTHPGWAVLELDMANACNTAAASSTAVSPCHTEGPSLPLSLPVALSTHDLHTQRRPRCARSQLSYRLLHHSQLAAAAKAFPPSMNFNPKPEYTINVHIKASPCQVLPVQCQMSYVPCDALQTAPSDAAAVLLTSHGVGMVGPAAQVDQVGAIRICPFHSESAQQ